jgi:hypothetical protein
MKLQKLLVLRLIFVKYFGTPLIQMLITSKRKIVEDFQRRHWIRHKHFFRNPLKIVFFNDLLAYSITVKVMRFFVGSVVLEFLKSM